MVRTSERTKRRDLRDVGCSLWAWSGNNRLQPHSRQVQKIGGINDGGNSCYHGDFINSRRVLSPHGLRAQRERRDDKTASERKDNLEA